MGFYKKIASLFLASRKTVPLTEEEKNLRYQRLQEDMGQFIYEDDGFRYLFNDHDEKLKYKAIERITGYKLDLMATDEICMDIFSGEWKVTFSESVQGWYQLLAKLKIIFPSIPDNWDGQIMQPPFATNYTVLYEREDRITPESTNFYAWLKTNNPEAVLAIFRQQSWQIRKAGWTEWELSNSWSELHLEPDSEGLLLNGLIAFHTDNINQLNQILDSLGQTYQYEFYGLEKQVLLDRKCP